MKAILVKYLVLLIFIAISAILFFGGGLVAEYVYDKFMYQDALIDNLMGYFYLTLKSWGVYIFLLLTAAVVGVVWSKKTNRKEVYKGFIYSTIFTMLLFVVYVIALIDAFA